MTLKIGCLIAMAIGIAWNVRCAVADHLAGRREAESLRKAMQWMPANAAYAAQYADQVYATDPGFAQFLLRKAVERNPFDAASWTQLGLLCEANSDMGSAESALLRAAGADNTFLPAWSLANFYFRRQNTPKFWFWARRAAQMAPDDATPLFRLAWYVNPSVPVIEDRLPLLRPAIESQLVNFLIVQGDPEAVNEAATHLLQTGNGDTTQSVLNACNWLLYARHPELALSLWNDLAARRRIAYTPLPSAEADTVTNGNFGWQPTSLGFDWHMAAVDGVSSFLNANPNALGFEFSGSEPDGFVLLSQVAPVDSQGQYALVIQYQSKGIDAGSGFTWTATDLRTGHLLASTESLYSPQGGSTVACFTAPTDSHFVDLSFRYQRQPGTVRPEGRLTLAKVRLATAASQPCGQKISSSGATSPGF